ILTYDWRGDRTTATTYGSAVVEYTDESGTTYADLKGTTEDFYTYDGAARLIDTSTQLVGGSSPEVLIDARTYDLASRMTSDTSYQVNTGSSTLSNTEQLNGYNANGSLNWAETWEGGATTQGDQLQAMVFYVNESGQSYYDYAGNLMGYDVAVHDPSQNDQYAYYTTDTISYLDGDSYLEVTQTASSTAETEAAPVGGQTEYTYNADQQLIQYTDTTKPANNRDFLNNAQGQALTVEYGINSAYPSGNTAYGANVQASAVFATALMSGTAAGKSIAGAQYYLYDSQGNSLGSYGELPGANITASFDPNLTPISPQYPQAQPQQYVLKTGDTLAQIAALVYGDASLWYIIAEANGLTQEGPATQLTSATETPLAEGTSLVIPNVVVDRSNNAQSFKPYDPSQVLGDTTPYQAPPPPPQAQGSGCGTFGQILVTLVAIVVSAYVGYEAYPVLTGAMGTLAGAAATGAVAGAAGSIASQTVGVAIGQQSSFNWSDVATAAISGAVEGGLVGYEGGFDAVAHSIEDQVVDAAITGAVNQEANIAFGLQKSFNWEAVAAATVAAPLAQDVGAEVGTKLQSLGTFGDNLAVGLAKGAVDEAAYAAFTGGKINYGQIAADGFGNAIGDGIVAAQSPQYGLTKAQQQQEYSDISASTARAVNQDGEQLDEDVTAALAQESAQAIAAGSTDTTTESPLTNNVELSS